MAKPPSLKREEEAWSRGCLLVGVDEVGRGPLAGPVVAAAVAFPPAAPRIRGIRDSKVLPARRRDALAALILERAAAVGVAGASVREINRLNIRGATALAMRRALLRAVGPMHPQSLRGPERVGPINPQSLRGPERAVAISDRLTILVDGLPFPEIGLPHDALVDGDALCYSIAAAGIVAKTVRDRLMTRLAARYDGYSWGTNMGYGTAEHLAALGLLGPSPHHRAEFSPVAQLRLL